MVYLPNKQPWLFISYCKDSKSKLRGHGAAAYPGIKLIACCYLWSRFFLFLFPFLAPSGITWQNKATQARISFFLPVRRLAVRNPDPAFFFLGETHPIIMNSHNNVMMRDHYYKTAWCRISTTSILSTPLLGLWSLYRSNAPMKWVFCVAQNNQGVGTIYVMQDGSCSIGNILFVTMYCMMHPKLSVDKLSSSTPR
jgi:hypothetical protein